MAVGGNAADIKNILKPAFRKKADYLTNKFMKIKGTVGKWSFAHKIFFDL